MKSILQGIPDGLVVLLCAASLLAQPVQTDYDHNFNLGKLKTYAFSQHARRVGDPLAASPINDRRIHDALEAELEANGFLSSEHPDFFIAYSVTTQKGLSIQDNRFGVLRGGFVNVNQVTEGTIIVTFVDSGTNQEVWRGYASGEINPKNFDKVVNKAISKLIRAFKKNQAGKK